MSHTAPIIPVRRSSHSIALLETRYVFSTQRRGDRGVRNRRNFWAQPQKISASSGPQRLRVNATNGPRAHGHVQGRSTRLSKRLDNYAPAIADPRSPGRRSAVRDRRHVGSIVAGVTTFFAGGFSGRKRLTTSAVQNASEKLARKWTRLDAIEAPLLVDLPSTISLTGRFGQLRRRLRN
jgi:hypothetical protein